MQHILGCLKSKPEIGFRLKPNYKSQVKILLKCVLFQKRVNNYFKIWPKVRFSLRGLNQGFPWQLLGGGWNVNLARLGLRLQLLVLLKVHIYFINYFFLYCIRLIGIGKRFKFGWKFIKLFQNKFFFIFRGRRFFKYAPVFFNFSISSDQELSYKSKLVQKRIHFLIVG